MIKFWIELFQKKKKLLHRIGYLILSPNDCYFFFQLFSLSDYGGSGVNVLHDRFICFIEFIVAVGRLIFPLKYCFLHYVFQLTYQLPINEILGRGMKGKLNNLMIQLRKNCNHPDLLESAFDGSCTSFLVHFVLLL